MDSYNEYMFLLKPSETVKQKISACKIGASQFIGSYPGMHSTAHISILKTQRSKPYLVRPFIARIKSKMSTMPPISIDVDGFSFFLHGGDLMTIYATVKPSYRTDNWFALLQQQLGLKNLKLTPHLTVVKTIPVNAFYQLWPKFKQLHYQESFIADRLTILEREAFNKHARWTIYDELPFKNTIGS